MRRYFLYSITVLIFSSCSKENDNHNHASDCNPSIEIFNTHKVEGYTDKVSYSVGDTINFKIHSLSQFVDISIYHYGYTTNLVHSDFGITSFQQNYNCRSYSYGCDWQTTYQYIVPVNLKSGIYSAYVTNNLSESCYISFIIKNPTLSQNDILVLASTNTWQSYNDWGGQSFYKYGLNEEITSSTIVSFLRPNTVDKPVGDDGHLVNAELHLHRWLEYMGYDFDVVADIDLHNSSTLLNNYKILILNGHPEYWSLSMYNNLINFLSNGGNLMYLGGNGIYWRVALAYDRIEVKKAGSYHSYDFGLGGKWRDLGRSESKYLGVQYTHDGFDTYAPYMVLEPNHWVFNGTNLNTGDLIGEVCLNKGGASGHETDKVGFNTPANIVLLAKGKNQNNGGAEMVYYQNPITHSKVFSVGSITYTGSLAVDTNISMITKNVINSFLQ